MEFKKVVSLKVKQIRWRKHNRHNSTYVASNFDISKVSVGKETYGPLIIRQYDNNATLQIGNYCSIADEVVFLLGGGHDYKRISTWPFLSKVYGDMKYLEEKNNNIIIEDDVWIGYGVLILSGIRIGKGSVIGAKAIVTKDVPPYSVFVGNKVIKERFSKDIVEKIKEINFSKICHNRSDIFRNYVLDRVTTDNVEEILKAFVE